MARELTFEEYILLDTVIYGLRESDFARVQDKTVDDLCEYALDYKDENPNLMSFNAITWVDAVTLIRKNAFLCEHRVVSVYHTETLGILVLNHPDQAAYTIISRGTVNLVEWLDNLGAAIIDVTDPTLEFVEYLEKLPQEYGEFTVSGHSRGGYLSAYAAIASARVKRAISVDGPGFSTAFFIHHANEIYKNNHKIINIASSHDPIHCMSIPLFGEQYIIKQRRDNHEHAMFNHSPLELLDADGNLNPEAPESDLVLAIREFQPGYMANNTSYMIKWMKDMLGTSDEDTLREYFTKQDIHLKHDLTIEEVREVFG